VRLRAVLLDLDGTIVKSALKGSEIRERALRRLRKEGLDLPGLEESRTIYHMLIRLSRRLGSMFPEVRKALFEEFDEYELSLVERITVAGGAATALATLREMGVKTAILTNSGRRYAELAVEKGEISGLFDLLVTRDDVETLKPSPRFVTLALRRLRVGREEVMLIGDASVDALLAKKVRVVFVASPSTVFPRERLLAEEPDYVIEGISTLPELVRRLAGA